MAEQVCNKCEQLLNHGDLVKAVIITRFVSLKSKLHYALEKPTECRYVEHLSCNDPKGDYETDND